jgi:hypothetical protein
MRGFQSLGVFVRKAREILGFRWQKVKIIETIYFIFKILIVNHFLNQVDGNQFKIYDLKSVFSLVYNQRKTKGNKWKLDFHMYEYNYLSFNQLSYLLIDILYFSHVLILYKLLYFVRIFYSVSVLSHIVYSLRCTLLTC